MWPLVAIHLSNDFCEKPSFSSTDPTETLENAAQTVQRLSHSEEEILKYITEVWGKSTFSIFAPLSSLHCIIKETDIGELGLPINSTFHFRPPHWEIISKPASFPVLKNPRQRKTSP